MNRFGKIHLFLTGLLVLLILAACNTSGISDEPPDIRYSADICDECNMIIDDARFAAAYVTTTGDIRRFDDIGDMLVYTQKHEEDVHIFWVHDYESADWINADQAVFVLSPSLTTPMAWGLAAFTNTIAAETFIAENDGHLTTFADLWAEVEAGAIDPDTLSAHLHTGPAGNHNHEMEMESEGIDHHEHADDGLN